MVVAVTLCQAQGQGTETALMQEYRRAHETKDVDAAMKLVDLTGVGPAIRKSLAGNFKDDFLLAIDKLEMVAPAPNQLTQYTREGRTYKTNLAVKKVLVVSFKPQPGTTQVGSTRYLVGEKGARYFIATAVPSE